MVQAPSPGFGRDLARAGVERSFEPARCHGQRCAEVFRVPVELARTP